MISTGNTHYPKVYSKITPWCDLCRHDGLGRGEATIRDSLHPPAPETA